MEQDIKSRHHNLLLRSFRDTAICKNFSRKIEDNTDCLRIDEL